MTADAATVGDAYWQASSKLWDIWSNRSAGAAHVDRMRKSRFDALVLHAREHSPFYRQAYRSLSDRHLLGGNLPVVTKRALMSRFDEWVTDRAVNLVDIKAFLEKRDNIGKRYLDRYIVWKSSGSTGEPGIFVQDPSALGTFDALMAAHIANDNARQSGWGLTSAGGAALIAATDDHFASIASWQRLCRESPWIQAHALSIMNPMKRIVADLNALQPAFLASYPTMLALLAHEVHAGRLHIRPERLWSGGERLSAEARDAITRAFGCPLTNEYGASECMSIAFGCEAGWLHVNADWVHLEPVDRNGQPTPPGDASETVLLTNLANYVQPIIRYDLGDSVVVKPGRCECGNDLPAICVEGRHDDILELIAHNGTKVRLPPLALSTVVEESAGVPRFQIVQAGPSSLTLRLETNLDHRSDKARAAMEALRGYLDSHGLTNVSITVAAGGPVVDPKNGKLREVVLNAAQQP